MRTSTKLTMADLAIIKNLLQAEYSEMVGHLATPAEMASVIIPLIKVDALINKAVK